MTLPNLLIVKAANASALRFESDNKGGGRMFVRWLGVTILIAEIDSTEAASLLRLVS